MYKVQSLIKLWYDMQCSDVCSKKNMLEPTVWNNSSMREITIAGPMGIEWTIWSKYPLDIKMWGLRWISEFIKKN